MKPKPIISAGLFAIIAIMSLGTQAASGTDKAVEAKSSVADTEADKATSRKMKPHSHVEEKTGVPQKAPEASPARPNPAKDMSRHYHPRDGK